MMKELVKKTSDERIWIYWYQEWIFGNEWRWKKRKDKKNIKLKLKWLREAKLKVLYERVLEDKLTPQETEWQLDTV